MDDLALWDRLRAASPLNDAGIWPHTALRQGPWASTSIRKCGIITFKFQLTASLTWLELSYQIYYCKKKSKGTCLCVSWFVTSHFICVIPRRGVKTVLTRRSYWSISISTYQSMYLSRSHTYSNAMCEGDRKTILFHMWLHKLVYIFFLRLFFYVSLVVVFT